MIINDKKILLNNNLIKLEENIWVLKNFVTKDQCKKMIAFAESVNENEWWLQDHQWYNGKFLNIVNTSVMETALEIHKNFKNLFENNNIDKYNFGTPLSIHRILPGDGMYIHADYPELDNFNKDYILFNTVVYLNDFEGGEVYYPDLGIEYKPSSGDLLMHSGLSKYKHEVKKVIGNTTRYVSTMWLADEIGETLRVSGNF